MEERTLRAAMLLGEDAMNKLENSHVAVFGLGGVGSWCAEALCRSGVGELTLIDEDSVSRSNINRQLIALESTVGKSKAEVLSERLLDINQRQKFTPSQAAMRPLTGSVFWLITTMLLTPLTLWPVR